MFSLEVDYLVSQEQYEDRRRKIERCQLIRVARVGQLGKRGTLQRMAGWFGFHLVTWGSMLQGFQTSTQRG